MSSVGKSPDLADLPYWMAVLAGLPIASCIAIMGLPDISSALPFAFRTLYFFAYLFWIFPLAYLQRRFWRKQSPWWSATAILLAASYAMSVFNSFLGRLLGIRLNLAHDIEWTKLFSGLDGCWLALIAFCAIHAVIAYYAALNRERVRVAEALALARDAQLRALRYQLHPHFLFNTLNAISALVATDRNREANRMIAQLGDFLRATLESEDTHEHALADELALTESYLDIEKARLGDKLKISVQLGPDVLHAFVPYLILQPLVENAIRHGIARRSEGGKLELQIAREGERLSIRVLNDSCCADALTDTSVEKSGGVGLRNVAERLAKLYEDTHDFAVTEGKDGMYQVAITLPLRLATETSQAWNRAA